MKWLSCILMLALLAPLAGCGVKGPLKSPAQIQQEQLKKQQERQAQDGSL